MQAAPQSFPDVPKWAEESVYYLVHKQVISGMPDGTFASNKVLSRAEAATIMAKILGLEVKEGEKPTLQTLKIIGQLLILLRWKKQVSLKVKEMGNLIQMVK